MYMQIKAIQGLPLKAVCDPQHPLLLKWSEVDRIQPKLPFFDMGMENKA